MEILFQSLSALALVLFLLGVRTYLKTAFRLRSLQSILLVVIWLGMLLWRMRTVQELQQSPFDVGSILRIASPLFVFVLLVPYLFSNRKALGTVFTMPLVFLSLFVFMGIVSASYSEYPSYTLFKAGEYLALIVWAASCSMLNKEHMIGVVYTLYILLVLTAASSVFWCVFLPSQALMVSPRGMIDVVLAGFKPVLNPNSLGTLAAIALVMTLYRRQVELKPKYAKLLALALFLVVFMAQSRTALVMTAAGILMLGYVARKRTFNLLLIVSILATLFLANMEQSMERYFLRGQTEEQLQYLSGRVGRWEVAMHMATDRPLFGYGYAAASRITFQRLVITETGGDTHSAWMDILIGLGSVGLLFYSLLFLYIIAFILSHKLWKVRICRGEKKFMALAGIMVVCLLIHTITSSASSMLSADAIILVFLATIVAMRNKHRPIPNF